MRGSFFIGGNVPRGDQFGHLIGARRCGLPTIVHETGMSKEIHFVNYSNPSQKNTLEANQIRFLGRKHL